MKKDCHPCRDEILCVRMNRKLVKNQCNAYNGMDRQHGVPKEESHRGRSKYVQRLVQDFNSSAVVSSAFAKKIPKRIIQFWDSVD